jgi:hypothetical protein
MATVSSWGPTELEYCTLFLQWVFRRRSSLFSLLECSVSSLNMAEIKSEHHVGGNVSLDDIEENASPITQEPPGSQTLDVRFPERTYHIVSLTNSRRDTLIFLPLSTLDSSYSFPGKPSP